MYRPGSFFLNEERRIESKNPCHDHFRQYQKEQNPQRKNYEGRFRIIEQAIVGAQKDVASAAKRNVNSKTPKARAAQLFPDAAMYSLQIRKQKPESQGQI
jgi:hypothetical protein